VKTEDLVKILETMDIPARRRELTNPNIRWMLRNLRVRNSQHEKIDDAIAALIEVA
jgi:hypothetical protein